MLPDDSNPSWPLTSLAAACEKIRSASASNHPMVLVFQPFLFECWGAVPIKTFIASPFLREGLGEEGAGKSSLSLLRSHSAVRS